ncbi:MAG: hypothetical protein K2P93_08300 [Alphaproteobacteria bacterium]|nr:hypothetical protein [Alphaproteobacteria bacterium]
MKILNVFMLSCFLLMGWSQFVKADEKDKQYQKEHQKEHIIPVAEHDVPKAQGGCSPWDPRCKK